MSDQAPPVEAPPAPAAPAAAAAPKRLTWRGSVGMNGHCPYCVTLLGLLLAASVADLITTEVALQRGMREANPIAKFLFEQLGRPAAFAFMTGVTVFFALRIHSHGLMATVVAFRIAPVINNSLLLWTPESCPK